MTVGPATTISPSSSSQTSAPLAGRPIGSGRVRITSDSVNSYEVHTLVSVGPYQLNSRTSGHAARRSAATRTGIGSPANAQTRKAVGGGPSSSPPYRIISTSADGAEYQTVMARSLRNLTNGSAA